MESLQTHLLRYSFLDGLLRLLARESASEGGKVMEAYNAVRHHRRRYTYCHYIWSEQHPARISWLTAKQHLRMADVPRPDGMVQEPI